jgi:hypothetical protein
VKMEAALWKRHWKATEQRMKEHRAKEDKKRQDAFLEKVYKERLAEIDADEESDIDWDPIEEVLEDSRVNYVGMWQSFKHMSAAGEKDSPANCYIYRSHRTFLVDGAFETTGQ